MEQTNGERLGVFMERHGIRTKDLARLLGVSSQSVSNWTTGSNRISQSHAERIVDTYPDLNYEWLITGQGDMIKKGEGVYEPQEKYGASNCLACVQKQARIELLEGMLERMEKKIDQLNRELGSKE